MPADEPSNRKVYLGDGAYASFDGYSIILTAENGAYATDRVYLEPMTYAALVAFVDSLKAPTPAQENTADFDKFINSSTVNAQTGLPDTTATPKGGEA